jgi:phosphoribosylformimino-5-aminoimidazole carboxamide ribotide isomerase
VIVYPAIDLLGGRVVRLRQGDYGRATTFDEDPAAVARRWAIEGAEWLHVVDLDGARGGRPARLGALASIAASAAVPVQFGGGLRTEADVEAAFAAGAARVVLGTAALRDPALLARVCAAHGDRVAVGLDARDGVVRVSGWTESAGLPLREAATRVVAAGAPRLIVTDIAHDGMMTGPNVALYGTLRPLGVPMIASGGVRSAADVRALRAAGLEGAIVGRALYDGALALVDALREARGATGPT